MQPMVRTASARIKGFGSCESCDPSEDQFTNAYKCSKILIGHGTVPCQPCACKSTPSIAAASIMEVQTMGRQNEISSMFRVGGGAQEQKKHLDKGVHGHDCQVWL